LQNRETGITQIVITHDMQFAQHIADEIVTINPK
jgi:polar amino acid transport system ATP-binding protein